MEKNKGAQGKIQSHITGGRVRRPPVDAAPTLAEIGITKDESSLWQKVARQSKNVLPPLDFPKNITRSPKFNGQLCVGKPVLMRWYVVWYRGI